MTPLALPAFRRLLVARSANEAAIWLGEVALAIAVLDATGSALATAGYFVAAQVAPALAAPIAIARLERGRVARVLSVLYAVEAAIFVALGLLADAVLLPVILALAAVDGTLALSARALTRATAADVLRPSGGLRSGNALLNIVVTLSQAAGPGIAGLVVAGIEPRGALFAGAGVMLLTAVTLATSRPLRRLESLGPTDGVQRIERAVAEGLAYVRDRPPIARLIGLQAVVFVFGAIAIPVEVVYAKVTLGAGDRGYGALLAAWGGGAVVGSLGFAAARRLALKPLIVASTAAMAVGYLGLSIAPTLGVACVAAAAGGLGNGVQWVAVMQAVQELTEQRFQARTVGLLESLSAALPGIGFVVGGALAQLAAPRAAFAVGGVGLLVMAAAGVGLLRALPWRGAVLPAEVAFAAAAAGRGPHPPPSEGHDGPTRNV